jgi:hypothetical protein
LQSELNKEELITRYLLDELQEAERERVIDQYLGDGEFFEQMLAVEEELIDDYVSDQLRAATRARFERHYLTIPEHRERVKHAQAFRLAVTRKKTHSRWQLLRNFLHQPSAVFEYTLAKATTVMLLVGISLGIPMLLHDRKLHAELQASQQREQELKALSNEQQQSNGLLTKELQVLQEQTDIRAAGQKRELELPRSVGRTIPNSQATPSPAGAAAILPRDVADAPPPREAAPPRPLRLVSFELRADSATGGRYPMLRHPELVSISPSIDVVQLQLNLRTDDYPSYRAVMRTASGDEILSQSGLKSELTSSGKAVLISFSAHLLKDGDYLIALEGVTDARALHALEQWRVRSLHK